MTGFKRGDIVRIAQGPFSGFRGTFLRIIDPVSTSTPEWHRRRYQFRLAYVRLSEVAFQRALAKDDCTSGTCTARSMVFEGVKYSGIAIDPEWLELIARETK